ncbi:putative oxidoreductase [Hordeum vulgare]|nr:putative oxidoreductase [Hordeum vulgare]
MGVATHMVVDMEKKLYAFSHCWIILDDKPKWTQLVDNLKSGKNRNDGSISHQSIESDDEEYNFVVVNGRTTVPHDNREVMDNKWEKERMEWDQTKAQKRMKIKRYKIELETQGAVIKWELEKAKTFREIQIQNDMLQLARDIGDVKIML